MDSADSVTTYLDPGASPSPWRRLRAIAFGPDSYGLVFLLLVGDYVILTSGWRGTAALVVSSAWLGLTVLLAFHTSRVPRRVLAVVRVVVVVGLLCALGVALAGGDQAYGAVILLVSLLVLASLVAIVWRVGQHTRVTDQTILGALSVYVLIGLVFANADYGLQLASGSSFFAQPGHHGPADFAYFSYITMATVGYGDLSPASGLPRTYAVTEALAGQIFLVVMVARLVSLYTPRGRRGERPEPAPAAETAPYSTDN